MDRPVLVGAAVGLRGLRGAARHLILLGPPGHALGPFYRWLHAGQHRSVTPTPWSSRAFDIAETIPHCAIVTLPAVTLPLHCLTL